MGDDRMTTLVAPRRALGLALLAGGALALLAAPAHGFGRGRGCRGRPVGCYTVYYPTCAPVYYPAPCWPVVTYPSYAPGWSPSRGGSTVRTPGGERPMDWVSSPRSQWPQLVLTNRGRFRGHTAPAWANGNMASAFLVK